MHTFYAASTRGFYNDEIHDPLPEDAVVITQENYESLLAAQAQGKLIVPTESGYPLAVDPPPLTVEQEQAVLLSRVQGLLDSRAREHGYDNVQAVISYATEPAVPAYQAEGIGFRAWRSETWAAVFVLLGTTPLPTWAEVEAVIPELVITP